MNDIKQTAVLAAHRRLAELQREKRKFDWFGDIYGTPVGRAEQIPPRDGDWHTWLYLAGRGSGKALCLKTPVLTTLGWKTMGTIVAGDFVFDENGKPTEVLEAHPVQINKDCYEIGFGGAGGKNPEKIIADGEHRWLTHDARFRAKLSKGKHKPTRKVGPEILETRELYEREATYILKKSQKQLSNYAIPAVSSSIKYPKSKEELLIPPYSLGAWLGDGTSKRAEISSMDEGILKEMEKDGFVFDEGYETGSKARLYRIMHERDVLTKKPGGRDIKQKIYKFHFKRLLQELKLFKNKHIPEVYMRAPISDRLALLQGLLDTDGWASIEGVSSFAQSRKSLAYQVKELAQSLGEVAYINKRMQTDGKRKTKYAVSWSCASEDRIPFRLKRKVNRVENRLQKARKLRKYHFIKSIEKVNSVPVRCISVANPTSLFLVGKSLIPTHNTRSAAEYIRHWVMEGRTRLALVAATAADCRDVMVSGESGILSVCFEDDKDFKGNFIGKPVYEASKRRVIWANGAIATMYSSETPSRLRGPQHMGAWCDELCSWQYARETFDMLQFGNRIGDNPQLIITTTPKPINLLREIASDPETIVTRGSTYDNADNLAPTFIHTIQKKYEGTSMGKQEIYAEILDEIEGALWRRAWLEKAHCRTAPDLVRVGVSIDPAVTANEETSSETGIVVGGITQNADKGYLLEDLSGIYTPLEWARKAAEAYYRHNADFIIAEVNNGGDLVIQNIKNYDKNIPCQTVHARKGKYLRAEPVSALYEQGRIYHVRNYGVRRDVPVYAAEFDKLSEEEKSSLHYIKDYEQLEDQLISWYPLGDMPSPDRLDALVHLFTALMIKPAAFSGSMALPAGSLVEPFISGLDY